VVAGVVAGCGGSGGGETAGAFITRILREEIAGQWAKQWDDLNPGHKRLITRNQYVHSSKGQKTSVGTPSATIKVRSVRDEPLHVRGVAQHTASVVTVVLVPTKGAAPETFRLHAVRDHGRWTWILGAQFLESLARGKCLDGSPLPPP
jgi:hypothetical protein